LIFLGDDIVYVKNNFSHATGSIAGMVSDDAGIQRTTSTDPSVPWSEHLPTECKK